MKISVITPSIRPQFLQMAQECLERQTFKDFEWHTEIGLRDRGYMLPTDWNKLLRRCNGDIVVMYQDCITIQPDALEKIAELDHDKKAYTFPVGKIATEKGVQGINWDWRKFREEALGDKKLQANNWEIDFASAPLSLFKDVGGFDEDFNNGWSWENVEIAWRADAAGYTFHSRTYPDGVALDHDAIIENPYRNKLPNNDWRANQTMEKARRGNFKLGFL